MKRLGTVSLLIVASLAFNFSLMMWFGVRIGQDAIVFFSGAKHLLEQRPFEGKELSYLSYVAVLAATRELGLSISVVAVLQILVAAAATVALYHLGRQLGGGLAGTVAAGLFVVNVDIARWHLYVLTDSLYISCVILAAWTTFRAVTGNAWWRLAAVATLLFAALLRPNGWLLVPIAPIYWISMSSLSRRTKVLAVAATSVALISAAAYVSPLHTALSTERPDRALRNGVILWAPRSWTMTMPHDGDADGGALSNLAGYVLRHPVATARLAAARVAVELVHARPFYSTAHNAAVLLILAVVYPLCALGLVRWRRQPVARLMTAIIGSDLLVVAATFADWDGRFLLHTFSLMLVFAAAEAVVRLGWGEGQVDLSCG